MVVFPLQKQLGIYPNIIFTNPESSAEKYTQQNPKAQRIKQKELQWHITQAKKLVISFKL